MVQNIKDQLLASFESIVLEIKKLSPEEQEKFLSASNDYTSNMLMHIEELKREVQDIVEKARIEELASKLES
ncbi:MAG: hypothetical protein RI935_259 [Candidatus Parcubacteria bacterium]|jgi:hypothetical protein